MKPQCLHLCAYLIALLFLPQCANRSRLVKKEVTVSIPRKKTPHMLDGEIPSAITIWVHGTRILKNTVYAKEFDCTPQLRHIQEIDHDRKLYKISRSIHLSNSHRFPWETFYVFGWPGTLRPSKREHAAERLYAEIQRVKHNYEKCYKQSPTIRIATHSHGGNVALYMAKHELDYNELPFCVDELIMLACPVQNYTQKYIQSPLFKNVYNIYSNLDFIQVIAPQFKRSQHKSIAWDNINLLPTSKRRFPHHEKVVQSKVKLNGQALMHNDFTVPRFLHSLHSVLNSMDEIKKHDIHAEKKHLVCVRTCKQRIQS